MTPELRARLEACKTLPTPPGVALQIIRLAHDPDANLKRVSEVLEWDPAITSKILRLANSPMYGQRGQIDSLRRAVVLLGLNATISLALSFSLLKTWKTANGKDGLDHPLLWRRAVLGAATGRVLARTVGIPDPEEVFLACLVQDIGIMALARAVEGIYDGFPEGQLRQDALIQREIERVGSDHAAVGRWLLESWNFPGRIAQGVAASHAPERIPADEKNGPFFRSIALAGLIAEAFLDKQGERQFTEVASAAEKYLQINGQQLQDVLQTVSSSLPDLEAIFETRILSDVGADSILEEARETLVLRNLQMIQKVEEKADSLERRVRDVEESSRRDGLTGLFNRPYMQTLLQEAFNSSSERGEPFSVAFLDLDNFKKVNDTYGHGTGDRILLTTARLLLENVRSSDFVGRYGGEEFVLLFPNTHHNVLSFICERIVAAFEGYAHEVASNKKIKVTVSIGIVTHGDTLKFDSVGDCVSAADRALYRAKHDGRNRCVSFNLVA